MRPHQIQRILAGILFLAVVVTVSLPRSRQTTLRYIETSVGSAVSYIQQSAATLMQATGRIWSGYIDLVHVQEENLRLQMTLDQLRGENHRLRVLEASALRLQELLDYRADVQRDVIAARVIGRDVIHWFDTIMLNKG